MKNVIFLHVATIGSYQEILMEFFESFEKYNIYDNIDNIFINIAGNGEIVIPNKKEIVIQKTRSKLTDFEFSTLNILRNYCFKNDVNVLYMHTKGASTPYNICINEWRQYMLFFNIKEHLEIIQQLNYYDACGVDFVDDPVKHFSGNFWWSKSSHIKTLLIPESLPEIISHRHKCEFWICSNKHGKYKSLYNSDINVYQRHLTRFPKEKYANDN